MLIATDINHFFDNTKILHNINFSLKEGKFVAITGKSGSGKTTLLSILSTLLKPTQGKVSLLGMDTTDIKNIDNFRRNNIGFVFQFHHLINYLTVLENVTIAMFSVYKNDIDPLLKSLDIYHLKNKYPHQISGGERQRVAIARALINKPKFIFADEPTGNLDSYNSQNVFNILRKISQSNNVSIIVATHDLELAKQADIIYKVTDGHIS